MKLLYITYLSPERHGTNLLETFEKVYNRPNDDNVDLLICYQGKQPEINFKYDQGQIILYSLDSDSQLRKWKKDNADVIPHFLGGEATKHSHPDLMAHPQNRALVKQIPNIVSISHGWNSYHNQYDFLVFIDSKGFFKKPLPSSKIFADTKSNFYYFQAPKKLSITKVKCEDSIDTRFLVFNKNNKIIPELLKEYQKQKFRDHPVWTPSFLLKSILNKYHNSKDLGKSLSPRCRVPLMDSDNPIHKYIGFQF